MFAQVNGKWIVNLSKVKYLGISNDSASKIEVKYDDGSTTTFSCYNEEDARRNFEHIVEMFDPTKTFDPDNGGMIR